MGNNSVNSLTLKDMDALKNELPAITAIAGDSILGIDGMSANLLHGPLPSMFNHANIVDKAFEVTGLEILSDTFSN